MKPPRPKRRYRFPALGIGFLLVLGTQDKQGLYKLIHGPASPEKNIHLCEQKISQKHPHQVDDIWVWLNINELGLRRF